MYPRAALDIHFLQLLIMFRVSDIMSIDISTKSMLPQAKT